MPAPRRAWSEDQLALLHDMVRQGLSRTAMANRLNMGKSTLDARMHHEGLRSSAMSAAKAPPPAYPDRLPQGCKVTLPPLPSLQMEGD